MVQSKALVDVIVPTRNRAAMTMEAIESVRAQTFQEWRLIVVDDASDESPAALDRAAAGEKRITILHRDRRGGEQAARQTGLEASTADFVALLDSDDLWERTKLERQVDRFFARQQELPDLGVVLCWHQWVNMDGSSRGEVRRPDVDGRAHPLVSNNMSTPLILREALDRIGGFVPAGLPPLHTAVNIEFYVRLTQACAFSVVEDLLVRCRHHSGDRSTNTNRTRHAADAFAFIASAYEPVLKRYPEQWATFLALTGRRYLLAGDRRKGLSFLKASASAAGPLTFMRILQEYAPFPRHRLHLAAQAVRRHVAR